jgi:hypothetical protein
LGLKRFDHSAGGEAMKRLERGDERRMHADRRGETVEFWRDELERRSGSSRRQGNLNRRRGSDDRRKQSMIRLRKQKRNRLLGKSSRKWLDSSIVPETVPMSSPQTMRRVSLCGMVELGRCSQENDMGIYVNNVLAGAITHNDEWHVWRLIEACDVNCASELRMYIDRLCHMASFPSLKKARIFVKGPFKRYVLAEMKVARTLKAG